MSPLVSVIIPVYNSEKYLRACIESVVGQSWKNWELIIVDDGSTDGSLEIAEIFQSEKIRVVSQKNQGASVARNRGLSEARGDYIQFLDADDYISPDKIEGQIGVLDGSETHISFCRTRFFYDEEEHILLDPRESWYNKDHPDPVDFLMKLYTGANLPSGYGGMIQPNAWLTPLALIKKGGPWSETRSPDDDGEFFCRAVLASDGIKFSNTGFNYYRRFRKNNSSLSGQKSLSAFEKMVWATDKKYAYLKVRTNDPLLDKIFAQQYWWFAVGAYPMHKKFSKLYRDKAIKLGYEGRKFVGGPMGHKIAKVFGWKIARYLVYYRQILKEK